MKKIAPALFFLFLAMHGVAQKTIFVNPLASGSANGLSWQTAWPDIQTAINAASNGDQIWVTAGFFTPDPGGSNRQARFELAAGVRLFGSFSGTETTLDQRNLANGPTTTLSGNVGNPNDSTDNSFHILYLWYPDTVTVIDGFEFRHGFAAGNEPFPNGSPEWSGGAVFVEGAGGEAYSTFRNCVFRDNHAKEFGGAVSIRSDNTLGNTPVFEHCRFENNTALHGGAVGWRGGSNWDRGIEFNHCQFIRNGASGVAGAAIIEKSFGLDKIEFGSCSFIKNYAESVSGTLNIVPSTQKISIHIDKCLFQENFISKPSGWATSTGRPAIF